MCRVAELQDFKTHTICFKTLAVYELIYKLVTFYIIVVGHIIYFTIVLPVLIYDYVFHIFTLFIYKHNFKHDVHAPFKFVIF